MRLLSTAATSLALAAAIGLLAPGGALAAEKAPPPAAAAPTGPKLAASAKFVKPAKAVQDLIVAKDYDGALAKIPEAEAAAATPDDHYFIGSFYLNIGIGKQDQTMQRKGLEAMVASGKVAPDLLGKYEVEIGKLAQIGKDIPGAREHYNKAIAAGNASSDPYVMLAESYFSDAYNNVADNQLTPQGKTIAQQGLPYLRKAIDTEKASGKPVPAEWYVRGLKMSVLASSPELGEWSKLTVSNAPTTDNWRLVLRALQDGNRAMTRDEDLDILRLMVLTKSLTNDYSYSEYAETAWRAGLPGEVVAVVDAGVAAGDIKKDRYADIYKLATAALPKDKASLNTAQADSAKAANGKIPANIGSAYMGYGEPAKAVTYYKLALEKGGVDANEVNTRLGIALAKSGDKAGAKAAFAAVTGTGLRKQLADLWTVWLDQQA